MRIYSPEARSLPPNLRAADRPKSLDGLRIGFLDNTKAPVDKIMAYLEERLRDRVPGIRPFYISKRDMGKPAGPEIMEALRENADVVINALGD